MKTMTKNAMLKRVVKTTAVLVIAVAGNVLADQRGEEILRRSDALIKTESEFLQSVYWEGLRHWQEGDPVQALRDLDYAAWQGSVAAAQRLCIMDAYGVGTEANSLKAMFWCEKAEGAGHDLAGVRRYLQDSWVATQ